MTVLHNRICHGPADCGAIGTCFRCGRTYGRCCEIQYDEGDGDGGSLVWLCFDCWLRSHEIETQTLGARVRTALHRLVSAARSLGGLR